MCSLYLLPVLGHSKLHVCEKWVMVAGPNSFKVDQPAQPILKVRSPVAMTKFSDNLYICLCINFFFPLSFK